MAIDGEAEAMASLNADECWMAPLYTVLPPMEMVSGAPRSAVAFEVTALGRGAAAAEPCSGGRKPTTWTAAGGKWPAPELDSPYHSGALPACRMMNTTSDASAARKELENGTSVARVTPNDTYSTEPSTGVEKSDAYSPARTATSGCSASSRSLDSVLDSGSRIKAGPKAATALAMLTPGALTIRRMASRIRVSSARSAGASVPSR